MFFGGRGKKSNSGLGNCQLCCGSVQTLQALSHLFVSGEGLRNMDGGRLVTGIVVVPAVEHCQTICVVGANKLPSAAAEAG